MITETHLETLPKIPASAGLSFRPLRDAADYPALARIINAANLADHVEEVESVEEVANEFAHLANCDPATDVLVVEVDGSPVGFSRVWWRLGDSGERLYWHLAYLDPAWRRRGIGQALLAWNEARLRAIAAGHAQAGAAYFQVWTQDTAQGKNALLEQAGYRPVRYFHFMQRKGLDDLPAAPLPDGVELRPVEPGHLRKVWEAKEDAFADHWGHTPGTEADFQRWAGEPSNDLGLWAVTWDGERVAGTALGYIFAQDNEHYGFRRGEVYYVGVRRDLRGRGLGRALLVACLRLLRGRGMTEAVLGVDSDSPTGALRLYESAGFRTISQDRVLRKPFGPGGI